jgi:glycosyltransferase involved in cell wall biosynthesis
MEKIIQPLYKLFHQLRTIWYDINLKEQVSFRQLRNVNEQRYTSFNQPLVTVTIPTLNRSQMLKDRSIPSILNQTYQNFEVVVVGDHCTDDTEHVLNSFNDSRIRFYNLPEPTKYPTNKFHRWRVGGTKPSNLALDMASGDWIAHLDDDEIFTSDRIEKMLQFAHETNSELVYGIHHEQRSAKQWDISDNPDPKQMKIARSGVMYRSYLKCFKYRDDTYKFNRPHDKDLWKRMLKSGVRMRYLNHLVTYAPLKPGELEKQAENWFPTQSTNND